MSAFDPKRTSNCELTRCSTPPSYPTAINFFRASDRGSNAKWTSTGGRRSIGKRAARRVTNGGVSVGFQFVCAVRINRGVCKLRCRGHRRRAAITRSTSDAAISAAGADPSYAVTKHDATARGFDVFRRAAEHHRNLFRLGRAMPNAARTATAKVLRNDPNLPGAR